MGVGTFLYILI